MTSVNFTIGKFYREIDYTLIPSIWQETGPLTLYESLYHKKPVIIRNIESMIWGKPLDKDMWDKGEFKKKKIKFKFKKKKKQKKAKTN